MKLFHRLASILWWIVHRDRAEGRLDDELRTFVEMATADRVKEGFSPAEARRLALIELGGLDQVKESVRGGRHGAFLDDVTRDVRYAFRLFGREHTFAIVIIGTLALGIGANTAIFSIIDSLLLRELPVSHPEQLARLVDSPPSRQETWTYPIWEEIQRHADRIGTAFAWSQFDAEFNLSAGGETQFVKGVWASANSFDALGVRPALGRLFVPADDRRGGRPGGPVIVISHALWQKRFGGTPEVIGRTLTLERVPLTIVGVTPAGFFGMAAGRSFDVVLPLGGEPVIRGRESRLDRRTSWWLPIFVRLKPGQSLSDATLAVQSLQPGVRDATRPPRSPSDHPERYLSSPFRFVSAATGQSGLREDYRRPLTVLMVVAALVLLIACANIANLLLARAAARGHEWNVRLALGASRSRLARQLLIESLLLAAMGGVTAVIVARWGSELLVAQLASDAVHLELPLDWRMLGFTAAIALVASFVFGVVPALRAARGVLVEAMKDRSRNNPARHARAASGLVIAQIVLSLVLVMGAGLFVRSFARLARVPLGFDSHRVLIATMDTRRSDIAPEARMNTYDRILQRVRSLPGLEQAGVSIVAPLGAMWSRRIEVSGSSLGTGEFIDGPEGFGFTDRPIPENAPLAVFNGITPGWMATYGTGLIAVRDFSNADGANAARVALVNQAFARKFLGGANPVGHTMRQANLPGARPIEIVGLVADAVYRDPHEPTLPTAYVPFTQSPDERQGADPAVSSAPSTVILSMRAAGDPAGLTRNVAAAIGEVNPTIAITFEPLDSRVSDVLMRERLLARLSAAFGLLALLMAAVGLYGVTSYSVNLRRTEIGIRMALGATQSSVLRLVLGPRVDAHRRGRCGRTDHRRVGVAFRRDAVVRSATP